MPRQAKRDPENNDHFACSRAPDCNWAHRPVRPSHLSAGSAAMGGDPALEQGRKEDQQDQERPVTGIRGVGNDPPENRTSAGCSCGEPGIREIALALIAFTQNQASGATGAAVPSSEQGRSAENAGAHSAASFRNIYEDLQKLERVILPALRQGKCPTHFSILDGEQGLDYEHGYRRIYDAYYGPDAITLRKAGDLYVIVNGYRRLFVAAILRLESLPARVLEESG